MHSCLLLRQFTNSIKTTRARNGDDIIVKEALQQNNTSNPFWFYLNTNQKAANTQYMGSEYYSYSNSTAFLSGFKTAPVLAADNESYYMIGVDRQFPITISSDLLYPTIMNITAQGVPTTNLKQLDPISNNDDNAPPAAPLIIQNSLLYFKSNYSLFQQHFYAFQVVLQLSLLAILH